MTQVSDDLYLGGFSWASGWPQMVKDAQRNPTSNLGVGPAGRVFYHNAIPLTAQTANIAALQGNTISVGLTLAAGTGVTAVAAPDGSGSTVYQFDTPRCASLTSAANLSAVNYTITGFDFYGQKMTQRRSGPNANTVNMLKAFYQILSVVPDATNASTVSIGSADIFGLPYCAADAGYVLAKWGEQLGLDASTFAPADTTSPATNATGDVRGTIAPTTVSNGVRRLVVWQHLPDAACGANATRAAALGVTQA